MSSGAADELIERAGRALLDAASLPARVATPNVSLTVMAPRPPELTDTLLVVGLALLLGFLVISLAGSAGSPGTT